jgi:hypothetical protein
MMNLAEYSRSTTRLADFLPWAALVDEGKPTRHLRRTARPSRPRVPGPEIPNQPNQQSTAQSSSTKVNASVHINDQQRTRQLTT